MRALSSSLRKELELAVLSGRRASEAASHSALDGLGVFVDRRPEHLDDEQTTLRNGLRAKWRQLGGDNELLLAECAYEQWHRLLFARFLAENKLLLHPQFRAAVTLEDCDDLAAELGEPDGWAVAARFAAEILPGIFRLDDPCVRLRLAPEGRFALEEIISGLSVEMFTADDALGWIYQFWQKDKRDEINASERKIGGADLGPVTQLFTENYMVRFLLENSLGAWWAHRHPESPLVSGFEYLRFDEAGQPAAGAFDGWPEYVAEVTVMDPCCGSGHFLVEAFSMLWQMRVEEEGLSPVNAQDAVLRDNLFGLELDSRCVQIAMFAVAVQSWKAGGGWRELPTPNIACSGIPVRAPVEEWKALAGGDHRLEGALVRLHILFRDADTLGSLINPQALTEQISSSGQTLLDHVGWPEVVPIVDAALSQEADDPAAQVLGSSVRGLTRAAVFLGDRYTLVCTNPPFLKGGRQSALIKDWIERQIPSARHDLAIAMHRRFHELSATLACVSPHGWLTGGWYKRFRTEELAICAWSLIAHVGPGGFTSISGEVVDVILLIQGATLGKRKIAAISINSGSPPEKAIELKSANIVWISQDKQQHNPDSRVLLAPLPEHSPLSDIAVGYAGIQTGDYPRFGRVFWEMPTIDDPWSKQQTTVRSTTFFGGLSQIVKWGGGTGQLRDFVSSQLGKGNEGAWLRGADLVGRRGVAVSSMSNLAVALFAGELFDNNTAVVVPKADADLPAVWSFLSSVEFEQLVRRLDSSLKVTNSTFVKVPFDLDRWRRVAEEAGPLPEPSSDDPTQWLFMGRPELSIAPLQVAAARLLGYRWPELVEADDLDSFADADGIVCLPSVAGEAPASDRLQQLLAASFGQAWTPTKAKELLEQTGSKKQTLHDWLRAEFFKQHCAMFENRPFIWHVWDGRPDGFSVLLNYHQLDRKMLEKLTYTYLGQDWVERQRAGVRDDVAGAEGRLAAALELQRKLEAILGGEKPYDIYVRWKELHEQPVGWEPDLGDGVRLNVRPFVEAGVLRVPFNIHWKKDRGKDPDGSERHNDVHLSLAEKLDARKRSGTP